MSTKFKCCIGILAYVTLIFSSCSKPGSENDADTNIHQVDGRLILILADSAGKTWDFFAHQPYFKDSVVLTNEAGNQIPLESKYDSISREFEIKGRAFNCYSYPADTIALHQEVTKKYKLYLRSNQNQVPDKQATISVSYRVLKKGGNHSLTDFKVYIDTIPAFRQSMFDQIFEIRIYR